MSLVVDPPLDGTRRYIPDDFEMLSRWAGIIRHANKTVIHGAKQYLVIVAFIDEEGNAMLHGQVDVLKIPTIAE